jgi:hypothetical protein
MTLLGAGIAAFAILAGATLPVLGAGLEKFGKSIATFGEVEWSSLAKAGAAIIGLGVAVAIFGALGPVVALGSLALIAMGAAFGIFATILSKTIGPLVTALSTVPKIFSELGKALSEFPIGKLAAFGAAALLAAPGIAALGVAAGAASAAKGIGQGIGSIAKGVGGFVSGGFKKAGSLLGFKQEGEVNTSKLNKVADASTKMQGVDAAANSVSALARAMAELGRALQVIDVSKLNQVMAAGKPSVGEMVKGAVAKVAGLFGFGKKEEAPTATTTTTAASGTPLINTAVGTAAANRTATGKVPEPVPVSAPTNDLSRLEQKLDAVVRAIGSMKVQMDGKEVGKILVNATEAASQVGVFRNQSRATL